ncbi:hypothetical protein LguiB_013005 [Lonicera macranthoides]
MVPINPILGEPPSRCWSPLNDTNRAQLASNIGVYHDTDLHSSGIPELAIICRMSEDSNTGNSEIGLIIGVVIPPGPIPSSGIVVLKPTPTVVAAANATSPPTLDPSPHPLCRKKDSIPSNTFMALNEVFGAHSPSSYHIQSPSHKLDFPHNDVPSFSKNFDSIANTSHSSKHSKANHHNTSFFEESFVPCSVSLKKQNLKTNANVMLHSTSFYTQHTSILPHNSFKKKSRFKNQFDPISDLYLDGDGDGENWDFFEEFDDDIASTIAHDDDQFHAITPSNDNIKENLIECSKLSVKESFNWGNMAEEEPFQSREALVDA